MYTGSARINGSRLVNSWLTPRFCVGCHSNQGIARALAQEQENLCTCVEAYVKVSPSICIAHPYRASFIARPVHTYIENMADCLGIELCQLKNGSGSPTSMSTPLLFQSL